MATDPDGFPRNREDMTEDYIHYYCFIYDTPLHAYACYKLIIPHQTSAPK